MKQQESLDKEGFHSENLDTEDRSPREPTCERGPGAGLLQMLPNHGWHTYIGHRRRHRLLQLLTRKRIR